MTEEAINLKVKNIIATILNVKNDVVTDELSIGDIPEWDSVANVRLLQALEEEFSIEIDVIDALDAEDVFDFCKLVRSYSH
mgnify:CR=1 FL=1